jgi:hypothetical protein
MSNKTDIESWYIPMDILRLVCIMITITIALMFLVIIALNKTCQTIPMMLVANTCVAQLVCVCTALGLVVFTLKNDMKQIEYQDSFCVFRAYINYGMTVIQNHSYNLQAVYRYMTVIHPSRFVWQSRRFQVCLIIITWLFGLLAFLTFLFTGDIKYNVENQICQAPLRLSFIIIYIAFIVYIIPNLILNVVYLKLVRYVRQMSQRVTSVNILSRAERELKMVRNIVTISTILVILGFPYAIFILMSFFTNIPKYHFRVAFIFIDISTTAVMIALFKTTDPVRTAAIQTITALGTRITRMNT